MTKTPTLLEDLDNCAQYRVSADEDNSYLRIRDFIIANQPWYPPQQEGFGPWIEYREGDPGPRVNDVVLFITDNERRAKNWDYVTFIARHLDWDTTIVAYCVKQTEE